MDLVYFSSSGKSILVLGLGLSVSAKSVSRLMGFFIFNSNFGLMKCSKVKAMGKEYLSSEVG